MIELHSTSTSNYLVLDTGCGTHIFADIHGLNESRMLRHDEIDLIMGTRHIVVITRIRDYELMLYSGYLILILYYCYSP